MISWGSLQATLALGKSIGNTLAGHKFSSCAKLCCKQYIMGHVCQRNICASF